MTDSATIMWSIIIMGGFFSSSDAVVVVGKVTFEVGFTGYLLKNDASE